MALSARLLLLNEHIQIKEPEPMDEMFGGKENARSHHLRVVRGGLAEVGVDTGMVGLQRGNSECHIAGLGGSLGSSNPC